MSRVLAFRLKVPGRSTVEGADVTDTSFRFHGLLRVDGDTLHLEWSGTAEITEVVGADVREEVMTLPTESLEVPLGRLRAVRFTGGWWAPRLELYGGDLTVLASVPGEAQGRVRLRVAWRDRHAARELAAELARGISGPTLAPPGGPAALPGT